MPNFIFEIIRAGEHPQVVDELSLPYFAAAWCNVEALAFKLQRTEAGAFIRVKDSGGRIVIFAGTSTALNSQKQCNRSDYPLKAASEGKPSDGDS